MESSKVLITLMLLIVLPVQCNARVEPYNYMENANQSTPKGEKDMHVGEHWQVIPSNPDAGGRGNGGLVASKRTGFKFTLLPKESAVPPSAPSKVHS